MREKPVRLRDLERYDEAYDQCYVRFLEMEFDRTVAVPAQFWRDVAIYGLPEAAVMAGAPVSAEVAEMLGNVRDPGMVAVCKEHGEEPVDGECPTCGTKDFVPRSQR